MHVFFYSFPQQFFIYRYTVFCHQAKFTFLLCLELGFYDSSQSWLTAFQENKVQLILATPAPCFFCLLFNVSKFKFGNFERTLCDPITDFWKSKKAPINLGKPNV